MGKHGKYEESGLDFLYLKSHEKQYSLILKYKINSLTCTIMEPKFEILCGFLNLAILPFKFDLSLYLILTNVPSYRNQKSTYRFFVMYSTSGWCYSLEVLYGTKINNLSCPKCLVLSWLFRLKVRLHQIKSLESGMDGYALDTKGGL